MSGHRIDWWFDLGYVRPRVVCEEPPAADCRLTTDGCPCESYTVERDPDGTPFHMADGERHAMRPQEECNIVLFLEDDAEELVDAEQKRFLVGSHQIEPLWEGDHYAWRRQEEQP